MNDPIIQIEVALNFVNTLFAKAVYYKDKEITKDLGDLRRDIYYASEFHYEKVIEKLKRLNEYLKKYE